MKLDSKILIFSDIHLGELSHSEALGKNGKFEVEDYKQIADQIKAALSEEGFAPNLLLIPGDLTSRGTPHEFLECSKFIKHTANILEITNDRILFTYGNHDVDWNVGKLEFDKENGSYDNLYCRLGALTGSLFAPPEPPKTQGPEAASGVYELSDLTVIVLNSGIECYPPNDTRNHDYHHGKLNQRQLAWLNSLEPSSIPTDRPCILMVHHHLTNIPFPIPIPDISTLEEGAEVLEKIGKLSVDLVVHGHRHHPAIHTEQRSDWKQPVSVLCAGSFGVNCMHRLTGKIPNTLHYVEFNRQTTDGNFGGSVATFEQNADDSWSLISDTSKHVALDGIQAFGQTTSDVDLDSLLGDILEKAVESAQTEYYPLPDYRDLDFKLLCIRSSRLNKRLKTLAQENGFKVTGKFPEKCILIPES